MTLEQLFAGRNVDILQVKARLKAAADELGLPLRDRSHTYNSRLAQELGKWAEKEGKGDAFHEAVFRAYFVEGKNIARIPVLVEVAESAGLPGGEAHQMLGSRMFKNEVDRDWQRSVSMGITAVPTFLVGRSAVVGAQPYENLEQIVRAGGAAPGKAAKGVGVPS